MPISLSLTRLAFEAVYPDVYIVMWRRHADPINRLNVPFPMTKTHVEDAKPGAMFAS